MKIKKIIFLLKLWILKKKDFSYNNFFRPKYAWNNDFSLIAWVVLWKKKKKDKNISDNFILFFFLCVIQWIHVFHVDIIPRRLWVTRTGTNLRTFTLIRSQATHANTTHRIILKDTNRARFELGQPNSAP